MRRIQALDPDVVHRIAAGEIIVSPANALKELIENSLDAGATSIDIVVKDGGHKLLQITDNGGGIEEEDLPILCQRFTTSKISKFTDLEQIQTLGFRGEALASISHIAHLVVRTKTKDSKTAVQAFFENGKLVSSKKSAGVNGTQISVEDLFYNVPLRLKALQSSGSRTAEYQKILDVVSKYAIQYPGNFSCKRFQDNQPVVINGESKRDRIRKVYGVEVHQQLVEYQLESYSVYGLGGVEGYITGLDYISKRSIPFIFFINRRLVSCEPLSRALRKMYQEHLPRGAAHAFVYLNLDIKPQNVDVNIHPTKREVNFMHETEIIELICERAKELITRQGDSRDFRVQSYISASVLPSGDGADAQLSSRLTLPRSSSGSGSGGSDRERARMQSSTSSSIAVNAKPRYEYNLVRTDPKQQMITAFTSSAEGNRPRIPNPEPEVSASDDENVESPEKLQGQTSHDKTPGSSGSVLASNTSSSPTSSSPTSSAPTSSGTGALTSDSNGTLRHTSSSQNLQQLREVPLGSVHELIDAVKSQASPQLLEMFSGHTYVGLVDPNKGLLAIQFDVRLYLVEYIDVLKEIFYQIGLTQFANFGTIHLGDGISISKLMKLAQVADAETVNLDSMLEMAPMLEEYFQIKLRERKDEWRIVQLPVMLAGYTPPMAKLPQFIENLATRINWEDEKACLDGVISALACFHVPTTKVTNSELETILSAAKHVYVPSRAIMSGVVEIASLPGLYKVFERC